MKNQQDLLDHFDDREKAIDHAMWLNFKYRIANISFGVIKGTQSKYAVCEEATATEMHVSFLNILPEDYADLSYSKLDSIVKDNNTLYHWDKVRTILSIIEGETLHFLIETKIPIDKLIRHELSARGYDANHRFCGFDKARDIWLK